ncbi:MAG: hypothetical protein EVJ48_07200 [Candidatus Acidulodesulfobacterium acidiphilum]|uniref:Uncharacterized protein n=1 Tax=Candidatus Acidulodesulfobacterium acidiphilum TaxID=2597224 RepID=A0A520XAU9_9DELT|nr:MAG: hypothetical protein EVJ48_07200 [Candidatus Acidulodesulfobacterium acidiphilum]
MDIAIKKISNQMIEESSNILAWLKQFKDYERPTAISILTHLKFISRDSYSTWFNKNIYPFLQGNEKFAFYAIRKMEATEELWEGNGDIINRPAEKLGSEDFVISLINNNNNFFDHPSIDKLKKEKINNIVLIDDAIGSGKRASTYIRKFINQKTLKSWWSYGIIKLYILSFARTIESEKIILDSLPGSNHHKRKYKKSEKINFNSPIIYTNKFLSKRWGAEYEHILKLCDSKTDIPENYRRGFGKVMSNIIFEHSVPNNIPGMLFCKKNHWLPLFPNRTIPIEIIEMLNNKPKKSTNKPVIQSIIKKNKSKSFNNQMINNEMLQLILLIKRGVRNKTSLSLRMDLDIKIINELLNKAICTGLITQKHFLTKSGKNFLHAQNINEDFNYDYSLYIPKSWCADQSSIQPFA